MLAISRFRLKIRDSSGRVAGYVVHQMANYIQIVVAHRRCSPYASARCIPAASSKTKP